MGNKTLITVIVLSSFQDKFDQKTQYPVGTELQVDEERAEDLVSRGLAKVKKVTAPKEPEPKATKPANQAQTTQAAAAAADADAENAGTESVTADAAVGSDNPEKKKQDEQPGTEE